MTKADELTNPFTRRDEWDDGARRWVVTRREKWSADWVQWEATSEDTPAPSHCPRCGEAITDRRYHLQPYAPGGQPVWRTGWMWCLMTQEGYVK